MDPVLIEAVAVADQDALACADQFQKGFLGTVGMKHEEGHHGVGHDPQPVELAVVLPGGLVQVVHRGVMGRFLDRLVMGQDRGRGPVNDLLNGAETDLAPQHRGQEGLGVSRLLLSIPLSSATRLENRGPKPVRNSKGDMALADLAATAAFPLVQTEVTHRHDDLGQLDVLVGVIRRLFRKALRAARAGAWM